MKEIEYDGFITREEDLMKSERTAKPMQECKYPKCGECDKYVDGYCTVPIVIDKQKYRFLEDILNGMITRLDNLEKVVWDEILGGE